MYVSMSACVGGLLIWGSGINPLPCCVVKPGAHQLGSTGWPVSPRDHLPLPLQVWCCMRVLSGFLHRCLRLDLVPPAYTASALLSEPPQPCPVYLQDWGFPDLVIRWTELFKLSSWQEKKIKSHSPAAMSRDVGGWDLPLTLLRLLQEVQVTSLAGMSAPWQGEALSSKHGMDKICISMCSYSFWQRGPTRWNSIIVSIDFFFCWLLLLHLSDFISLFQAICGILFIL